MRLPDARLYVVGLLIDCPYQPNPADCDLYEIRKKPLEERIEWYRQLTNEQIQHIVSNHKECSARREGKSSSAKK